MEKITTFFDFELSRTMLDALKRKGFEEPTEIQAKCIPLMLEANINVVGQAQTGTGKTAAFGIPIIERISDSIETQAIVLTPTRELAIQVSEEINSLKGNKNIHVTPIYGGQAIQQQIQRLNRGVQVVVGTPGRVMDHLRRKTLNLDKIKYLILDEADEMLNMGFIEDIESIMSYTPEEKNMLLFSATMPKRILNLTEKYMPEYTHIEIKKEQLTTNLTDQIYFEVRESDKFEALCRIIDMEIEFYGVVFCRTKNDVDRIATKLVDRDYEAEALHGDISQNQREKIILKFKNKKLNILVATDVAARGLDIDNLSHVINYSLPQDPEGYVHRIGRTGRAGKEGTAVTFITPSEYRKLTFIQRITKSQIRKESLPKAKDIIKAKKRRIKESVEKIISSNKRFELKDFAEELLSEKEAIDVVCALLDHHYSEELSENNYNDIRQNLPDSKGQTRLFVAKGKKDNMTKRKLVDYIIRNTGVKNSTIDDVKVFDAFSFISVPFQEAEIILKAFKDIKNKNHRQPIVVKAKK